VGATEHLCFSQLHQVLKYIYFHKLTNPLGVTSLQDIAAACWKNKPGPKPRLVGAQRRGHTLPHPVSFSIQDGRAVLNLASWSPCAWLCNGQWSPAGDRRCLSTSVIFLSFAKCKSSNRKDCREMQPEPPHRTQLNGGTPLGRPKVHLAGKNH